MGLGKPIEMPNGVTLNYHRVVSVNIITNNQNTIEVASYVSVKKRLEERECIKALAEGDNEASCDVYIETSVFSAPYDPNMTVSSAYGWLKEKEESGVFAGAEDVFEGSAEEVLEKKKES